MKPVKEGKVREIYDNGDSLIMVATDRISCFDVILHNTVTNKGKVLTQMSKFWFDLTKDIVPNHMISTDVKEMPELIVLKHTAMPAVLVEMAFIDNDADAALLTQRSDDFARAIARGVTDWQLLQ